MIRITSRLLATGGLIVFPLIDSAIKGTVVLLLAACVCVALRRDSAANRHFVWGIAICLLTVMPILSLILPGWNILPSWHQPQAQPITVTQTTPAFTANDPGLQISGVLKDDSAMTSAVPSDFGNEDVSELPIVATTRSFDLHSNPSQLQQVVPTATQPLNWPALLMLTWLIVFSGLIGRLCLAAWLLRRSANRCAEASTHDRMHDALLRAKDSMGVSRPVRLLMDQHRSIPLAWGLFTARLQLPLEAESWTDEQLQSVLHHELAHVRRNDLFVLWITQFACAMHWFNPLAWFAAWRLHIERERACDDLVLASGIPASAYAEHLLNIATHLKSAAWTQSCGLAMARNSSLHNRLTAVLSEKQNRRCVTTVLLVLSMLTGSLVAIPLAMLRAADQASQNDSLDNLIEEQAIIQEAAPGNTVSKKTITKKALGARVYNGMDAALIRRWHKLEGAGKDIPETHVATLRAAISRFINSIDDSEFSLTKEQILELQAVRKTGIERTLHTSREAQRIINAVFAIHGEPIQMAFNEAAWPGIAGDPLELEQLPFGAPAANGLRVALACGRENFIFGDSWTLNIRLWNSGSETLVVGIGRNSSGVYPKLELKAVGRNGRSVTTKIGPEPKMLADTKFSKTWQLRPGETATVPGYRIRVGSGTPREAEGWPQWLTMIELPDVFSGEEIQLTGSLPILTAPGIKSQGSEVDNTGMKTGSIKIHATAPNDVKVWTADRPGTWPMPNGVKLQLKQECFHAADIATSINLTWPTDESGTTHAFTTAVASDAFANRQPWHSVWEKDSTSFWTMTGPLGFTGTGLPTASYVQQIDFSDKTKVITTLWHYRPKAMSDGVRLAFEKRFQPLSPKSPHPQLAKGFTTTKMAHDVRSINELLNGVWKNRDNQINVRLTFPQQKKDGIKWTIDYGQQDGDAVVSETLATIRSPSDNSIRLWVRPDPARRFVNDDLVGHLRRGPDSTLLLDVKESTAFPNYKAATGIVLVRATGADADIAPLGKTSAKQSPQADDENTDKTASRSSTAMKLPPGIQQHLDWSLPTNGLRAAVMIRTVKPKSESKAQRNIFLVIQNVSDQPIRFCDTAIHETKQVAANIEGRTLRLSRDGTTLMGIQRGVSSGTDVVLQANDTHIIDMLDSDLLEPQGSNTAALLAEGVVKKPKQALYAILNIVHAPDEAWTGKLTTPASRAAHSAIGPMPQDTEARALFRYCVDHARLSGEIPGGLISQLHDMVKEFIGLASGFNPSSLGAKRMRLLLVNFQHQGDWKQSDVVALFDEIAAVNISPFNLTMTFIREHTLQRGVPLQPSLKNANWSKRLPSGLRMAWVLEPQANEYHMGASLKSRVVLHNAGKEPVAFVTRSFYQPKHAARLTDGGELGIESTGWLLRGEPEPYRLHPGESCEVNAPGIVMGQRRQTPDDWANVHPGFWITATEGQEITFQPGEVMLTGDHNQKTDPHWWLTFIKERLDREAPLPADQQERELILFRVVSDLFGNSPTPNEAAAFYRDKSPDALNNLAVRLSKRPGMKSAAGPIRGGQSKFQVLPIDPDAATRVRVATNPGRYNLDEQLRLVVSRQPLGESVVNNASFVRHPPWLDPFPLALPPSPRDDSVVLNIPLPHGYETWAAAWLPGSTELWVQQEGLLRKYDFANPADIKQTSFATEAAAGTTDEVRDALQRAITVQNAPTRQSQPSADVR